MVPLSENHLDTLRDDDGNMMYLFDKSNDQFMMDIVITNLGEIVDALPCEFGTMVLD